jgi:hypothetical protein
MSDAVYTAGTLVRFIHLGSACLLTGIFAFLVFVARPAIKAGSAALDGFCRFDHRLLSLAAVVLGVTIGTGQLDLTRQALVAGAGGASNGLTIHTLGALLGDTRYLSERRVPHTRGDPWSDGGEDAGLHGSQPDSAHGAFTRRLRALHARAPPRADRHSGDRA